MFFYYRTDILLDLCSSDDMKDQREIKYEFGVIYLMAAAVT